MLKFAFCPKTSDKICYNLEKKDKQGKRLNYELR